MSRSKILPLLVVFAVFTTAGVLSQAQSFTVIHNFSGAADGEYPYAGPTLDRYGNLYGTTYLSGPQGAGTVYKLSQHNGYWILSLLYAFGGHNDGGQPIAPVTIGPNGTLYGTTYNYGSGGYGTVFNVHAPARACASIICPWVDTTLHSFSAGNDGGSPYSNVVFDSHGNMYGTTYDGGTYNGGTVYKMTYSGGAWSESIIANLGNGSDGYYPIGGLVLDSVGNLYGTTQNGGAYNQGTVFELSPSGGGWTETVLHSFGLNTGCTNIGAYPMAGLVFDSAGNLYGTTQGGGYGGCGTIFELSPQGSSWNFSTIYVFPGNGGPAEGPESALAIDSAGNLYGKP